LKSQICDWDNINEQTINIYPSIKR
jgi:hypothetical protein